MKLFRTAPLVVFAALLWIGCQSQSSAPKQGPSPEALTQKYTMVRRDSDGSLTAIPYHEYFAESMSLVADRLREAAELAENDGLRRYLELRAEALTTGEYRPSDMAWMDMKTNVLDVVIGPIETYEDQLFGYKAAAETFVLHKDMEWSQRLSRYAELLPSLQKGLPVPQKYKQEPPGRNSDLGGAYDVLYVSGDANAGPKTIAINLPNDEVVQQKKGSRRLQLKNAMRAKFDEILTLQGDGDYEAVSAFLERYGSMPDQLRSDLDRLEQEGIPVDITFEQGPSVLKGLTPEGPAE